MVFFYFQLIVRVYGCSEGQIERPDINNIKRKICCYHTVCDESKLFKILRESKGNNCENLFLDYKIFLFFSGTVEIKYFIRYFCKFYLNINKRFNKLIKKNS